MKVSNNLLVVNFIKNTLILFSLFNYSSCIRIAHKEHPDPMVLNVTYEFPIHDLTERRLHAKELFNYKNRAKELEIKIEKDSQLLKMILNVQNIQIQKMTEIYYLNQALLFHYVLDKKEKDKTREKLKGLGDPDIAKIIRLDHPDRIREFLDKIFDAGMINESYKKMNNKELFDNFKNILEKAIIGNKSKSSLN